MMTKVVCSVAVSLDGFMAGPNQGPEAPFGEGEGIESLHRWMFEEPDRHQDVLQSMNNVGAHIMGRNMFGPGRGVWDLDWRGWWGDEPPYHTPVFVLTHNPREPLPMIGGTTFYFVTEGLEVALSQAQEAAGEGDVAVVGGAQTINQALAAGMIDELFLHVAPVVFGQGERLFEGVPAMRLELLETSGTNLITHLRYSVKR